MPTVAEAFGTLEGYYSTSGKNSDTNYTQQSLEALLSSCEIISIHAPLNAQTQNLIHEENLKLLRENSILLNLGRGGIVNESDLAKALDERTIYAGLDVVEKEPIPEENPLLHIEAQERLLITPHIAWSSKEARVKLLEGIVENISSFLDKVI